MLSASMILRIIALLMIVSPLPGCLTSSTALPLAPNVDLNSIYGSWYIVATIPNSFEKGMIAA